MGKSIKMGRAGCSSRFRKTSHLGLLSLALFAVAVTHAEDPALDTHAQQAAPTAFAVAPPTPKLSWGTGDGKSFLIPALDIVGFDFLVNRFDRYLVDKKDYNVTLDSWHKNITGKWVVDNDPFAINQFGHPYQGSMYFGFGRSAGLNYWESLGGTLLGSLLWEELGETSPPSINDQFTTGVGGSFLGEPLFRLSSLLLESGTGEPGFWRELGAALISPATGFNRAAYGRRFDGVFRSHSPAVYTRIQIGMNINADVSSNVNTNRTVGEPATPQGYRTGEGSFDITVTYGLPGKPGYTYNRPFDYFAFQFTASTGSIFENITSRGLLLGAPYEAGPNFRGLWGLFGSYDYIAPQIFRVSATSGGFGTTGQWWLARSVALQGSAIGSVGYGSAGAIRGAGERDYHNGIAPSALLSSRLIFGDRFAIEGALRDYYVGGLASRETSGSENIARGEIGLTVRVYNLHGVTLKYTASRRDARYPHAPNIRQSVGAISIAYSYLGQTRFGAVDWRPSEDGGPD